MDKDFRGQGIGHQLLTFAINHLAQHHKQITIDVTPENMRAKKLYESFGFQFASEPYAPELLRGIKTIA